jgi:integrase/recombinase XerC
VATLGAWGEWLHESGASSSEVNALLRGAQRSRSPLRDCAIVQLMLQIGIRIGECAALQIADRDLGEKSGTLQVRAGKGNKYREVPLNSSARAALALYLAPILGSADDSMRGVARAWAERRRELAATPLW